MRHPTGNGVPQGLSRQADLPRARGHEGGGDHGELQAAHARRGIADEARTGRQDPGVARRGHPDLHAVRIRRGEGSVDLLVYSHGDTPGAKWGRAVAEADRVNVFGPRGSIAIAALAGPVVVFGDETSSRARPATRTSTSSTRSFALAPAAPSTSRVRRSRSRDSALASRRSLRSPHRR